MSKKDHSIISIESMRDLMNIINGKVKPPDGHKIIAEMHFDGDDPRLTTRVVKEDFEIPK